MIWALITLLLVMVLVTMAGLILIGGGLLAYHWFARLFLSGRLYDDGPDDE